MSPAPKLFLALSSLLLFAGSLAAENGSATDRFQPIDVFDLEYAADPQISPDGSRVIYVRTFFDIMTDRARSNLWIVGADGGNHRPLTTGNANDRSPRWSPDGGRVAYLSGRDGGSQIYLRWLDSGQTAKLTQLTGSPAGITWSPDGRWLAFTMLVPTKSEPMVAMPSKPRGAEWAEPAKVIETLRYRADGAGYLEDGYSQVFVLSADGGTPRQLTRGAFQHGGPLSWSPDSRSLIFSANRHENWEYDPANSEVFELQVDATPDGSLRQLTDRHGPDQSPAISPDGRLIAYLGYDDRYQGYQVTRLYVMNRDGSGSRTLTASLDRSVGRPTWKGDSSGLYFSYDDLGDTRLAFVDLEGGVAQRASSVGGLSLGRPYSGSSFSVSRDGRLAYTLSKPTRPADVAVCCSAGGREPRQLTELNEDLFAYKQLAEIEELWWESSFDKRRVQGWIAKPPGFDPEQKYPLILEIHGGPFANYGPRFAAEIQLYAAAGYVVLYTNPRGSTSYGEEFGNLIHHAYPGHDYDDLMSGVDAVMARGYVDEERLFVTGGSGGGVLSSWIVGHTDRFAGAVVQKPVINWYSWVLTADIATTYKYWFPALPWEDPQHYLRRSPLSYVGNVVTPTMLLTGEEDFRTPMSESEQYYQALKLREVPAALVRIPGASHGIAARPSNLVAKVLHVLAWFERQPPTPSP